MSAAVTQHFRRVCIFLKFTGVIRFDEFWIGIFRLWH